MKLLERLLLERAEEQQREVRLDDRLGDRLKRLRCLVPDCIATVSATHSKSGLCQKHAQRLYMQAFWAKKKAAK